mmetsp:Transcript_7403/g.13962  ORF Transcript_7403/g.13962 Transcript_7403/m.13962 type:complete len:209 (-) Transcript_7403:737-1363(-)
MSHAKSSIRHDIRKNVRGNGIVREQLVLGSPHHLSGKSATPQPGHDLPLYQLHRLMEGGVVLRVHLVQPRHELLAAVREEVPRQRELGDGVVHALAQLEAGLVSQLPLDGVLHLREGAHAVNHVVWEVVLQPLESARVLLENLVPQVRLRGAHVGGAHHLLGSHSGFGRALAGFERGVASLQLSLDGGFFVHVQNHRLEPRARVAFVL